MAMQYQHGTDSEPSDSEEKSLMSLPNPMLTPQLPLPGQDGDPGSASSSVRSIEHRERRARTLLVGAMQVLVDGRPGHNGSRKSRNLDRSSNATSRGYHHTSQMHGESLTAIESDGSGREESIGSMLPPRTPPRGAVARLHEGSMHEGSNEESHMLTEGGLGSDGSHEDRRVQREGLSKSQN